MFRHCVSCPLKRKSGHRILTGTRVEEVEVDMEEVEVEKDGEEGESETEFDVWEVHEAACGLQQQLALGPLCARRPQMWILNVFV